MTFFRTWTSQLLARLSCGALVAWTRLAKTAHTWRVQAHCCYKFDNAYHGFAPSDLTAHFSVSLHLRVTNLPGPDSIMRSDQAQQRRMVRAAGTYDRNRLRKQLAQQSASDLDHTAPVQRRAEQCTTSTTACCQYPSKRQQPLCLFLHATTHRHHASAPGFSDFQCFIAASDAALFSAHVVCAFLSDFTPEMLGACLESSPR